MSLFLLEVGVWLVCVWIESSHSPLVLALCSEDLEIFTGAASSQGDASWTASPLDDGELSSVVVS